MKIFETFGQYLNRPTAVTRIALTIMYCVSMVACGRSDNSVLPSLGSSTNNTAATSTSSTTYETTELGTDIVDLQLVTPTSGWVLTNKELLWSFDTGSHWEKINLPEKLPGSAILGAFFLDAFQGWLVYPDLATNNTRESTFSILHTSDGGQTWTENTIAKIVPALMGATPAYVDFVDQQHGWVALRQPTSSNFNIGVLYETNDGGQNWVERTIPIGSPISFISTTDGWTAGGAVSDELYVTRDGGQNWQKQSIIPSQTTGTVQLTYSLPTFFNPQDGVLPVTITTDTGSSVTFYTSHDGGASWAESASTSLPDSVEPGIQLGAKALKDGEYLVVSPDGKSKMSKDGGKSWKEAGASDGIYKLSFVNDTTGWALRSAGSCAKLKEQCSHDSEVLSTDDGGQTWSPLLTLTVNSGK